MGKPKGVQIPHDALTNLLWGFAEQIGVSEKDVLLAVTSLSFDIAGLELWLPMIRGATVHIASQEDALDSRTLKMALVQATICPSIVWWRSAATKSSARACSSGFAGVERIWSDGDDDLVGSMEARCAPEPCLSGPRNREYAALCARRIHVASPYRRSRRPVHCGHWPRSRLFESSRFDRGTVCPQPFRPSWQPHVPHRRPCALE